MEGDVSNSESIQNSGHEFGVGSEYLLKPRAKKMDKGEKSDSKKRRSRKIEVSIDPDDDEPIGALFKVMKSHNTKKVKSKSNVRGDKGKKVEIRQEKLGPGSKDLGEMDDTLACFKKKLKGPKKDSGHIVTIGSSYLRDAEESDKLSNCLIKDGELSVSKDVEKGKMVSEDILDVIMNEVVEIKTVSKAKRNKQASISKNLTGHAEFDEGPLQIREESVSYHGDISNYTSDKILENSLFVSYGKVPYGLNNDSKAYLGLKQETVLQSAEDVITLHGPGDFAKGYQPMSFRRPRPGSGSEIRLVGEISNLEACNSEIKVVGNQSSGDVVHDSNCLQDTVLFDQDEMTHQAIPEQSKFDFTSRFNAGLASCSNKSENVVDEHALNEQMYGLQKVSEEYTCGYEHTSDGKDKDFVDITSQDVYMQSSISAANRINEIYTCKADALNRGHTDSFDQHLSSLKENPIPPFYEKLWNKPSEQKSPIEKLEENCKADDAKSNVEHLKDLQHTETLAAHRELNSIKTEQNQNFDVQNRPDHLGLNIASAPLSKEDPLTSGCTNYNDFPIDEKIEDHPENENSVSLPVITFKDDTALAVQRGTCNSKKRRQGDMAYEGDVDWNCLMHEQGLFISGQAVDSDRPCRIKDSFDPSLNIVMETDNNGQAAAVSAGLKARTAGPVEKIRFKEVLKRKGGLQEYLDCRNYILGLWSQDVTQILFFVDCGVTEVPLEDEPPRASLIREIYAFLDQRGYINTGVASNKKKEGSNAKHSKKLIHQKNFGKKYGASMVDIEDGVSFILGKNSGDKSPKSEAIEGTRLTTHNTLELSTLTEGEECSADLNHENGRTDGDFEEKLINLDLPNTDSTSKMPDIRAARLTTPELMSDSYSVQSTTIDCVDRNILTQCDFESSKKVIVVGAGPAGLTAARHLSRQGFSVTVLEARSRIGGRVYTDRSSLSVPVDIGASIITGVEADVATERRADPSALVCSQLGLELSVLNSDCPLYDTVTGQKVPADIDEALEAEYNGLLDDMVLLVAENGDLAMNMSLEDGLEYALKKRHTLLQSGSGRDPTEKMFSDEDVLSPIERRVMNWHFAHLEYGCAALLKDVSLPYWNQDDVYGGFGGAHCMIKGGYSNVVESLSEGLHIQLNHVVTDISYSVNNDPSKGVKISTSNGSEFLGDAVLVTVPLGCLKAETINFTPPLPVWKQSSIQRLGFGVLNKVALEFPNVFWDDSVDYFGATAEETDLRGQCFMFWNVRKTVGAPVLIALLVGKAAIDGQSLSSSDHVHRAIMVLRKLFGSDTVPDPIASIVTDWGRDPFSYGAYSYVAIGSSGEDYDILGRPVENCIFFAGEATCKEHPDTVGGAMMSGLKEAVRIIDILSSENDYTAEVEALEAAHRHTDSEWIEARDIKKRLDAVELSNVMYKNSFDGARILTRKGFLQEMFSTAKTTAGRLFLAKELLKIPSKVLKSFAGTKEGLTTLNSWILDSMGKDGTQLLRHCVRILVLVSTDLLAVRMSGIGKTVKEKVCVHTSRDIRAIASQLVNLWIEIFRKEKASNGALKLLRQTNAIESSKSRFLKGQGLGKPPLRTNHGVPDNKGNIRKMNGKSIKLETISDSKSDINSSKSEGSTSRFEVNGEKNENVLLSEEEQAILIATEAARTAALTAVEAYASSEAKCNTLPDLPKIPSFHKFARREHYTQVDEPNLKIKWPGDMLGRQDCITEIESRNCRVNNWSIDFSAACANPGSSKMSIDNRSQRSSHSNEISCQNLREHSGESVAMESRKLFTKAWVDSAGSEGIKDHHAIDRWQSQAEAADSDYFRPDMNHIKDDEDSNTNSKPHSWTHHDRMGNETSVSQVTVNKHSVDKHARGADRIKQAVVDYVASLLMPLYKARKIDKEGYKSIMKKTATKVMEQASDSEKSMSVSEFLDFKRKNKIRPFVDKLIERHMSMKPAGNV